jgi:hypothetical protein
MQTPLSDSNWKKWCNLQKKGQATHHINAFLDSSQLANKGQASKIRVGLNRAHALLKSAAEDSQSKLTRAGNVRDLQWRFVMSYAAWELVSADIFNKKPGDLPNVDEYDRVRAKIQIENISFIKNPRTDSPKKVDGLDIQKRSDIIDRVFIRPDCKDALRSWFISRKGIDRWLEFFKLAKAVRNASVHGQLSPTGVEKLGLKSFMQTATTTYSLLLDRLLEKLLAS